MRARISKFALLCALLAVAACVLGYGMSAPTDAAPGMRLPHKAWQQDEQSSADVQAVMAGRERPAARPMRSDYDDPSLRARSSQLEALLQRPGDRVRD